MVTRNINDCRYESMTTIIEDNQGFLLTLSHAPVVGAFEGDVGNRTFTRSNFVILL